MDRSKHNLTETKASETKSNKLNRTNRANQENQVNQKNIEIPAEVRLTADRLFRIPVFLSHPTFQTLNTLQQQFIIRLIREIQSELFFPRTLPRTEGYPESILTNVRRMILSSYGLVAANLRLTEVEVIGSNIPGPVKPDVFWIGSAFAQIEPAMAFQRGLPLLLIFEKGVRQEGIYAFGIAPFTILTWDSEAPNPIESFFKSVVWREILQNWSAEVRSGYYHETDPEFSYMCMPSNDN